MELVWDGKKKAIDRTALPIRLIEVTDELGPIPETTGRPDSRLSAHLEPRIRPVGWRNRLVWGENRHTLASLLKRFAGRVDLIYIDPPFATGQDFSVQLEVGDRKRSEGSSALREKAYGDTWKGGLDEYLQMLYERLVLMRELLSDRGSLYVHLDPTAAHPVKLILDEIFGSACFQREIIWRIGWVSGYKSAARNWVRNHDTILFYVKDPKRFIFNKQYVPYAPGYKRRGPDGDRRKGKGYPIEDVWNGSPAELALTGERSLDSIQIKSFSEEKTGFATQKNESLVARIVQVSSNEGSLVADFFCGSGTTGVVAEKLGRRWILGDASRWAVQVTRKRLLAIKGCRPFEMMDFGGVARRECLRAALGRGIGKRASAHRWESMHTRLVLTSFGAEPIAGLTHVQGRCDDRMIQVGPSDEPVRWRAVRDALRECREVGAAKLDVLGWEWDADLRAPAEEEAANLGIALRMVQIPPELMDGRRAGGGNLRFGEIGRLDVVPEVHGRKARLRIAGYVLSGPELVPEEVRQKIAGWSDYLDYWAVDFEFGGEVFHNRWRDFRCRTKRELRLTTDWHVYPRRGCHQVLVKAMDVLGTESTRLLRVNV